MSGNGVHLYGEYERPEMAALLPEAAQRILDVGCGTGAFGAHVKSARPGVEVVGVEPNPEAAELARRRLDMVHDGFFPDVQPGGTFDVVCFNDVLEHMIDPGPALETAARLAPVVIASLPNIRHVDVVRDLVLRGDWTYRDEGVLDRTHLRFYTRASAVALFESHGFKVREVQPINLYSRNRNLTRALRVLRDRRFLPLQFALVAHSGS